jgi:hypothetical protein
VGSEKEATVLADLELEGRAGRRGTDVFGGYCSGPSPGTL